MGSQNKKLQEYRNARNDGLRLAQKIVHESGVKGLDDYMRFSQKTGINANLSKQELEVATYDMRSFLNEAHILIWLSVLHDEFDFGKKRLNQAMDRFEQIYASIDTGYAGLADYTELLNEKMGRVLKVDAVIKNDMYRTEDGRIVGV